MLQIYFYFYYLNVTFTNIWIGRKSCIEYSRRSSDLTQLDFFLWGYLKDGVYTIRPNTIEALKIIIKEKCHEITRKTLSIVCIDIELCIAEQGRQFELLIQNLNFKIKFLTLINSFFFNLLHFGLHKIQNRNSILHNFYKLLKGVYIF